MKGAELPINIIIIFILALAVLIAMIAIFMGVWTPGAASLSQESAKNSACQKYVGSGHCEKGTSTSYDSGSTINLDKNVECRCTEAQLGSGTGTDVETFEINNLEKLAKCCFGRTEGTGTGEMTAAAKLCC